MADGVSMGVCMCRWCGVWSEDGCVGIRMGLQWCGWVCARDVGLVSGLWSEAGCVWVRMVCSDENSMCVARMICRSRDGCVRVTMGV